LQTRVWLADAKEVERMVYHENFEEFLRDAEKAVDKGLSRGARPLG